jgi:hypothetical protein
MKKPDTKAASILFGVELETVIPAGCGVQVGNYHRGVQVAAGLRKTDGTVLVAPKFGRLPWRAEHDGSIRGSGVACEFVSPILQGEEGVAALCEFVDFITAIGATVNDSCGCHVTVNVDSIIGSNDHAKRGEFARKLAHIAQWHARSIYGQTGTGRHVNSYSHTFAADVANLVKTMEKHPDLRFKESAAIACGRGMVNFRKLFSHGLVEFRAFAGTTSVAKVQHHVATAIGLCRRAAEVECLGAFKKNKVQEARTRTAADAVKFLWDYLGWTGSKRDCALGLFGRLHTEFRQYRKEALRLCRQFDERYPHAPL